MRKDRARVFHVQINNLKINISSLQTAQESVNYNRRTPIKNYPQGLHLPLIKRKKYKVTNFEANFLKIIFLVKEQHGSHATTYLRAKSTFNVSTTILMLPEISHMLPTCKINYVNMQHNCVNMRLIYVDMQHNYVDMHGINFCQ